jgi:CRISPR system Cascade subunit CasE
MILSRFVLDVDHSEARRDLSNPYDMHRTVKRLCGEETPLWRLENDLVLMQSETEPAWSALHKDYLARDPEQRPFPVEKLQLEGRELRFRLRANPTVSRKQEVDGARHSLYKEEEQRAWLDRQAARGGFEVLAMEITESGRQRFQKPQGRGQTITIYPCMFEGRLRVTAVEAFRRTLRDGIGSAKAFGLGMLSIAGATS